MQKIQIGHLVRFLNVLNVLRIDERESGKLVLFQVHHEQLVDGGHEAVGSVLWLLLIPPKSGLLEGARVLAVLLHTMIAK